MSPVSRQCSWAHLSAASAVLNQMPSEAVISIPAALCQPRHIVNLRVLALPVVLLQYSESAFSGLRRMRALYLSSACSDAMAVGLARSCLNCVIAAPASYNAVFCSLTVLCGYLMLVTNALSPVFVVAIDICIWGRCLAAFLETRRFLVFVL